MPMRRTGVPNLLRMWSRLWSRSVPWHRSWHPISCPTRTLHFLVLMDGGSLASCLTWRGHFSLTELGIAKNSLAPHLLSTGGLVSGSCAPSSSCSTLPLRSCWITTGRCFVASTPSMVPPLGSSSILLTSVCGQSNSTGFADMQNETMRQLPLQGLPVHPLSTRLSLGMPPSEQPWLTSFGGMRTFIVQPSSFSHVSNQRVKAWPTELCRTPWTRTLAWAVGNLVQDQGQGQSIVNVNLSAPGNKQGMATPRQVRRFATPSIPLEAVHAEAAMIATFASLASSGDMVSTIAKPGTGSDSLLPLPHPPAWQGWGPWWQRRQQDGQGQSSSLTSYGGSLRELGPRGCTA